MAIWMATATTTKAIVLRKDTRTVGSVAISAKFSRPTNCGGVMTSQRKNASTTEATIGTSVNITIPPIVGARKSVATSRWRQAPSVSRPAGLGGFGRSASSSGFGAGTTAVTAAS
jgi:hypothetical protein